MPRRDRPTQPMFRMEGCGSIGALPQGTRRCTPSSIPWHPRSNSTTECFSGGTDGHARTDFGRCRLETEQQEDPP